MECPVCLEPLTGTVVQLGCCNNQLHIQCYLPKCPLCRAELPVPRPMHTVVPVPVPVTIVEQRQVISRRVFITNIVSGFVLLGCGYVIFVSQKP
jgi:hypothetical protein